MGGSKSKQDKGRKQHGLMGVVVFIVQRPPFPKKICLHVSDRDVLREGNV